MTKYFISYKYTDIPLEQIHNLIDPIRDFFLGKGNVYCNLYSDNYYKENKFTSKKIMTDALDNLSKCNIFIMVASGKIGSSMFVEYGYALKMKIPIILIIKNDVDCNVIRDFAQVIIEYEDNTEILAGLHQHYKE